MSLEHTRPDEILYQPEQLISQESGEKTCLSSFRLVLHVIRGADLGPDGLEVRHGLVDDAQLLGRRGRRFWRRADDGHLLVL